MLHLLMRTAVAALMMLLLGLAHAEERPRFADLRVDLANLNPAWWEGFLEAKEEDRTRFFRVLREQLEATARPPLDQLPERQRLVQALEQLEQLAGQSQQVPQPVLPAERYSLEEWAALITRQQELEQLLAEQQQLRTTERSRAERLRRESATELLRYRELGATDPGKRPMAMRIVSAQLRFLAASLAEQRARRLESLLGEEIARLDRIIADSVSRIVADQNEVIALEQRRARLEEQAEPPATGSDIETSADVRELATQVRALGARTEIGRAAVMLRIAAMAARRQAVDADEAEQSALGLEGALRQARNRLNMLQEKMLASETADDRERYRQLKKLQEIRRSLVRADQDLAWLRIAARYADRFEQKLRSWWEAPVETLRSFWQQSGKLVVAALNYPLFTINESPVSLLNLGWLVIIITAAILISRQLRRLLMRIAARQQAFNEAAVFTVSRIVHYLIMAVAIITGLSAIGLDLSSLALVAGALSVGIGFGLQSIFNNFISGIILLFERPFKVGDLVELESGVRGRIRSINVRSTHINTNDNIDILVPNSEFISGRVTNYTLADDLRRMHIPFGVAYGSDKELVRKAALEAAESVPWTLRDQDHQPDVWLLSFGESSLDFELIVWIHYNQLPRGHRVMTDYLWALETALTRHGIEIPFPQRDLHLRSLDERAIDQLRRVWQPGRNE